jgi:hypothetical protein
MNTSINLAVALTVSLCALAADPTQTVVEYGKYNGGALQMVVEEGGRIVLRVALGTATEKIDRLDRVRADDFLGKEVERLTFQRKAMPLGESGYRFSWESGYPFDGPQEQISNGILYEALWFGENAQVIGREIKGKGRELRDLQSGAAQGNGGNVVRMFPRPGDICSDRERAANSVSPELRERLHNAIARGDFKKVIEVVDTPGSGLSVHGNSVAIWVTNRDGCTVAMRLLHPQPRLQP